MTLTGGPVYCTDNGKTKVAMTKGTTYDGYANYLWFLFKDQYTVLEKWSVAAYVQHRTVGGSDFGDDRNDRPVRQPLYGRYKLVMDVSFLSVSEMPKGSQGTTC